MSQPGQSKRVAGESASSSHNGTSTAARMKVISKKLITLSTQKVHNRNAAIAGNLTNINTANSGSGSNALGLQNVVTADSKSVSTTRPSKHKLNFSSGIGAAASVGSTNSNTSSGAAVGKLSHHKHSSAMSRFNGNPSL